jgi:hypothetical protein
MLIQLIKEIFLLLFWRELTPKPDNKIPVGFKEKKIPRAQMAATWALVTFLLTVSIPHSYEVIHRYEKGDEQFRDIKSLLTAITIEVIAALVLGIALHNKKLDPKRRKTMYRMAAPFVFLTLHLQFVYYAGMNDWQIYPWELALVLPGGILVGAVVIAFLSSLAETEAQTVNSTPQSQTDPNIVEKLVRLGAGLDRVFQQLETHSERLDHITMAVFAPPPPPLPQTPSWQVEAQPQTAKVAQVVEEQPQNQPQNQPQPQSEIEEVLTATAKEFAEVPALAKTATAKPKLSLVIGAGAADGGSDWPEPEEEAQKPTATATSVEAQPQNQPQTAKLEAPELSGLSDQTRNEWAYKLWLSGWTFAELGNWMNCAENTAKYRAKSYADTHGLEFKKPNNK